MLFDTTVRRELARTFGATLLVILTIVITMMLVRTLGQAAGGAVAPQDVVLLLGYSALGHLPTILSLSLFIATVSALGRLYRDSEMVVWFSSGVSLKRFVRPVLRTAWPILLVVGVLVVFVWPWGNRMNSDLRDRYEQRNDLSRVAPGVFQSSRDGKRVFFVEREADAELNARNVFVLWRNEQREAVTSARSGHIESDGDRRFLVLDMGQRSEVNAVTRESTQASFQSYRVLVSERTVELASERAPKAKPTLELIRSTQARDQGELTWRLGLFLGAINLTLLGIGLAATHPRRASNWNLLFALLGFVVYYNLINLSQAWVAGSRLSLELALISLHLPAFVLALALLWWRDHATVVTLPWRRRARIQP